MANHQFSTLSAARRCVQHLALAAVLATSVGAAYAQAEPSLKQIYDTAQSGKVAEAQVMVQQVLTLHPKSAKAHFVQAELFARQGNAARAREALAEADKLAPGLPFANAASVAALREQLAVKAAAGNSKQALGNTAKAAAPAPASPSFPLGLGLALGGAAIGAAIFFSRRKSTTPAAPVASPSAYGNAPTNFNTNPGMGGGVGGMSRTGSGLSGPQTFGAGTAGAPGYGNPGYGSPGYGQPVPPAGGAMSGMGGRLAGGLATGLAVGAGVMAAQAIGNSFANRNDAGHTDKAADSATGNPGTLAQDAGQPLAGNQDLGGQNFGMNESAGSAWDDAGSADSFVADAGDLGGGGGGDWDT